MPSSPRAKRKVVKVPYSEAAIHFGVAGSTLIAVEENRFINNKPIPTNKRIGCYVICCGGKFSMLKSEAGWKD